MLSKITKKGLLGLFTLSVFVITAGCDLYKSDVTEISGVDKTVCQQFTDSVFASVKAQVVTHYNPRWADINLPAFADSLIDTLLIDSVFIEQDNELAYELTLGSGDDTSYVAIKANSSGIIIFCTDIVKMNLYDSKGETYALSGNEMPPETISGCTQADESDVKQPLIKMRENYKVSAGSILLQLIKAEQTKSSVFKIAVQ